MLPRFDERGNLPAGIHESTLQEVDTRFGRFQGNDRRPKLWTEFVSYFHATQSSRLIDELLLAGSFVTAKPDPNDIDIIVVVSAGHDFGADLSPTHYNVLAARRVRRRFGVDIVVVKNGTDQLTQAVEFFAQVRHQPALRKGLLKLKL